MTTYEFYSLIIGGFYAISIWTIVIVWFISMKRRKTNDD